MRSPDNYEAKWLGLQPCSLLTTACPLPLESHRLGSFLGWMEPKGDRAFTGSAGCCKTRPPPNMQPVIPVSEEVSPRDCHAHQQIHTYCSPHPPRLFFFTQMVTLHTLLHLFFFFPHLLSPGGHSILVHKELPHFFLWPQNVCSLVCLTQIYYHLSI